MKKILVCGGRDYTDKENLWRVLGAIDPFEVVTGAADGADFMAESWAISFDKVVHSHPADWKTHGKSAGHIRNAEMLKDHPDIACVIAFPGGKGTENMIQLARKKGFPVLRAEK